MFSLQHGIVKKEHWYILCVCFVYTCRYNKTFVFDACVCVCGSYKPCGPKGRIQHAISQCLHSLDSQQIFFFQFCGVYLFLKRNWICTGHMSKKHMAVAHANHHSGINHMNYVHSSPPCKDGFLPAAFAFIGQRSWSLRKPLAICLPILVVLVLLA